jgi:alpha-ketoglutarate-dependent taurine dioxygenase
MLPYLLKETHAYEAWREQKLNCYPKQVDELIIDLNNPIKLADKEIQAITSACAKTNIVFYRCSSDISIDKRSVLAIAKQIGLHQLDPNICADEDKISAIQCTEDSSSYYIPYTNKALNWHTDGYYNPEAQRIRAFLMHCIRKAKSGGKNSYLDPEIAYIYLRDENPAFIAALMDETVMTIPANEIEGKKIRAAQSGPVFYIDKDANLCMRYTARQRNVEWKKDKTVQSALACLQEILNDNPYIFVHQLQPGEGVICNNVLHNRSAFEDYIEGNKKRLLYRGRSYNRVSNNQALLGVVNQ